MKLHRKIKHNEKVCRAHDLDSYAQGQGRNQAEVKIVSQQKLKNFWSKFNETSQKDRTYNKKVCHAQELGSYAQG